jgi:hypothetical protein
MSCNTKTTGRAALTKGSVADLQGLAGASGPTEEDTNEALPSLSSFLHFPSPFSLSITVLAMIVAMCFTGLAFFAVTLFLLGWLSPYAYRLLPILRFLHRAFPGVLLSIATYDLKREELSRIGAQAGAAALDAAGTTSTPEEGATAVFLGCLERSKLPLIFSIVVMAVTTALIGSQLPLPSSLRLTELTFTVFFFPPSFSLPHSRHYSVVPAYINILFMTTKERSFLAVQRVGHLTEFVLLSSTSFFFSHLFPYSGGLAGLPAPSAPSTSAPSSPPSLYSTAAKTGRSRASTSRLSPPFSSSRMQASTVRAVGRDSKLVDTRSNVAPTQPNFYSRMAEADQRSLEKWAGRATDETFGTPPSSVLRWVVELGRRYGRWIGRRKGRLPVQISDGGMDNA